MDTSNRTAGTLNLTFSEDCRHAARIHNKDLVVYSNPAEEPKAVQFERFPKDAPHIVKFNVTSESHSGQGVDDTRRLLLVSGATMSVWGINPLQKLADIQNLEAEWLHVDFGADENEVIVFHSWNTRVTLLCMNSSKMTVIKQPKLAHPHGYGYRPKTRELAILLKPDASDVLTIHERQSYELLHRAVLPTVDAQGLKWSPDGRWIAVWDLPSLGTKVLIYTADGQLFRTYTGPSGVNDTHDTGVKHIEWSPVSNRSSVSQLLTVGKISGNIELLNTQTFSSSTTLSHVFQTDQYPPRIWRERFTNAFGDAEYAEASSSSAFNMCPEPSGPPKGVSTMTFSSDGAFLATVDSARSNVVWIWSLTENTSLASVLVHEQPVRQLAWHPRTPQLLISTLTNALPGVRWWSPQGRPVIARVPTKANENGRYEVKWVKLAEGDNVTKSDPRPVYDSAFWFGSSEEYVVGYLSEIEGAVQFELLNSVSSNTDYISESCR